jgi:uncharacterized protein YcnI
MARMSRVIARVGIVPATAVAALALAGPASAHVSITASETAAGAFTVLTLSVPHGCDGSPTTEVAIKMPDGIAEVTPTRNALYDLETVTSKLDDPIVAEDGDAITEGVSQVVYTARTPLPDGQRDTFELSLQIPEDAAGKTLAFPTIQTCEEGSTAWTEVAADGRSEDDLEHPAPAFVVTGATSADAEDEDGDSGDLLALAGLVAGLLGLALGAAALARTRGARNGPGHSSGAHTED